MRDTEIKNARITRTEIGFHDGFGSIPCLWIHLDYGGAGQAFGGHGLGGTFTHAMLYGIINALEAPSWEKLTGMYCRVESGHSKVVRIGHVLKDQWYTPEATA